MMTVAEKIETLVLCNLQHGTVTGTCGTVERDRSGAFKVRTACGMSVIARTDRFGWRVWIGSFVGHDTSLLEAAHMAVTAR